MKHECETSELTKLYDKWAPGTCKFKSGAVAKCDHVDAEDHWCNYTDADEYARVTTGGVVVTVLMAAIMVCGICLCLVSWPSRTC